MTHSYFRTLSLAILLAGLAACSKEAATPEPAVQAMSTMEYVAQQQAARKQRIAGDCGTVFGAEVCTWGEKANGVLIAFGATVPLAMADNAEMEGEFVFPPLTMARIALPEEVTAKTGVDHLGINWEVHGHPPGPYLTPHFDFHFNTVSGADIEAIDCSDTSKPENPPEGYVLPDLDIPELGMLVGLCVPAMGMHALDEAEMNSTDLFEGTMVVGYYAREIIFIEPMIARDKLLKREDFTLEVPFLPGRGDDVSTPGGFKATYNAETDAYEFAFSMSARQ